MDRAGPGLRTGCESKKTKDRMSAPVTRSPSVAGKASWISLGLALAGGAVLLLFLMADQVSPFDRTRNGVLTAWIPRAALLLAWGGEALAAVLGMIGLLLIRRKDKEANAVARIVMRCALGIILGLMGTVILWLIVGHVVYGF